MSYAIVLLPLIKMNIFCLVLFFLFGLVITPKKTENEVIQNFNALSIQDLINIAIFDALCESQELVEK